MVMAYMEGPEDSGEGVRGGSGGRAAGTFVGTGGIRERSPEVLGRWKGTGAFARAAALYRGVCRLPQRASDECNKKQPSDCDTLEYRNGEGK
uniref:Uncharacterized protein n=1 Tax=Timema bartmani TaxID=61472 RepID=A0A7R9ETS0_9NEOP|nr:unnamed protein product [Timema bartmani]